LAIELYGLNIRVSQILYGALHGYEITLRNAMHDRLRHHFGRDAWYEKAELTPYHSDMVEKAKVEAAVGWPVGKAEPPVSKVVAELNLGFWTGLIAGCYEQSLWQTCLVKAFPNAKVSRSKAHPLFSDIKSIRNRVAHHERVLGSNGTLYAGLHPIHRTELTLRPERVLECIGWVCNETAAWVSTTSGIESCITLLDSPVMKELQF
jgi:hypothetical protein